MTHYILGDFHIRTAQLFPTQKTDVVFIKKIKGTLNLMHFLVPVDDQVKIKESGKVDKYMDIARELKKKKKRKKYNTSVIV